MKKRGLTIKINFTNRWLYTFIAIGILAIVGVGVYAAAIAKGASGTPGHNIQDMGPPISCNSGEFLRYDGTTNTWVCANPTDYCAGGTCNGNLNVTGKLTASNGRLAFYNITDKGCGGGGTMTFSATCTTAMGSAGDCGYSYRFNRCGEISVYPNCRTSPQTCPNTLLGWLV